MSEAAAPYAEQVAAAAAPYAERAHVLAQEAQARGNQLAQEGQKYAQEVREEASKSLAEAQVAAAAKMEALALEVQVRNQGGKLHSVLFPSSKRLGTYQWYLSRAVLYCWAFFLCSFLIEPALLYVLNMHPQPLPYGTVVSVKRKASVGFLCAEDVHFYASTTTL